MDIKQALNEGIVVFTYQKVNGQVRDAIGTMLPEFLPEPAAGAGTGRPVPAENVLYYDIEAEGYRSCKAKNIMDWYKQRPVTNFKKYLTIKGK